MKPPPYCSSLQDGGGFLCLGFFGWCGSALGSVFGADALAGFGGIRGFTGQRGRGSAPSAALGALRTEPPPRVPGMRLWAYLRYALVCTYMNGTLPKWTNSEPGCVLYGFMLG